jgi:hypothetical protein
MMIFVLRIILTVSSFSFFVIVYLVHNKINPFAVFFGHYYWITYAVYFFLPFILTIIAVELCRLLPKFNFSGIESIETSGVSFLADYLALFFVALSVNDIITFWVVLGMVIIFTFFSKVSYFNPIFLVYGFTVYFANTKEDKKIILISRKKIKDPKTFKARTARKITDYIYIEI